jgi:tetratricopeptide (TPR) repeat protein
MLASKGVHVVLALLVAIVTIYAGRALSPWLCVPGAVLFVLLAMSATDLIEHIAIQRALRELSRDERFAELAEEADRLLAQDMPEEAEEAYLEALEHRDEKPVVIGRYMHMARRSREMGDYQEARKWLTRAKSVTRA